MYVCVCVCVRERERERGGGTCLTSQGQKNIRQGSLDWTKKSALSCNDTPTQSLTIHTHTCFPTMFRGREKADMVQVCARELSSLSVLYSPNISEPGYFDPKTILNAQSKPAHPAISSNRILSFILS